MTRDFWFTVLIGVFLAAVGVSMTLVIDRTDQAAHVSVEKDGPQEKERRRIRMAASSAQAMDAALVEGGWDVSLMYSAVTIEPYELFERSRAALRNVHRSGVDIARVSVVIQSDAIEDKWGYPVEDQPVLHLVYTGEDLERVNWSGIHPLKLRDNATSVWMHETVREKLQDVLEAMGQGQQSQADAEGGFGAGGGDETGDGSAAN